MSKARALVDTSVLVRFFVEADTTFSNLLSEYEIWIPDAVFFETAFVLKSVYQVDRVVIFDKLSAIALDTRIDCNKEILLNTLLDFKNHPNLGLIDCYLLNLARKHKLKLESFDKKLKRKIKISD